MFNYMDAKFNTYFDRAFIILETVDEEPLYIPIVLRGRAGLDGVREQHNCLSIRKQKDKHWFRVRDKSLNLGYKKEDLKRLFNEDPSFSPYAIKNGTPFSREEYIKWMMSAVDSAETVESHRFIGNRTVVGEQFDNGSRYQSVSTEKELLSKYNPDSEVLFRDVSVKRAPKNGKAKRIFAIFLDNGYYFKKFTSTKIHYNGDVRYARHFLSENEVFKYIEEFSYRYFGTNGFEIVEFEKDGDNFIKVEF